MDFIGNLGITTSSKIRTRNRRQGDHMIHGDSRPLSLTPTRSHSPLLRINHQATTPRLRVVPTRFIRAKQATSKRLVWAFTLERLCLFLLQTVFFMLVLPSRWMPSISRCSSRITSRIRIPSHPSSRMRRALSSIKIRAMRRWRRLTDRQWATSVWTATSTGCLCVLASSTVVWQHRRLNHLESELEPQPSYGLLIDQCAALP